MSKSLRVMAWNVEGEHFQEESEHDLAAEFQVNQNPAGVWTFGYSTLTGDDRILIPFDAGRNDRTTGGAAQV